MNGKEWEGWRQTRSLGCGSRQPPLWFFLTNLESKLLALLIGSGNGRHDAWSRKTACETVVPLTMEPRGSYCLVARKPPQSQHSTLNTKIKRNFSVPDACIYHSVLCQVSWRMPVIALGKRRQGDQSEFETSLNYLERRYLKNKQNKPKTKNHPVLLSLFQCTSTSKSLLLAMSLVHQESRASGVLVQVGPFKRAHAVHAITASWKDACLRTPPPC